MSPALPVDPLPLSHQGGNNLLVQIKHIYMKMYLSRYHLSSNWLNKKKKQQFCVLKYLEVKHLWLTINSVCMCNRENKCNMLILVESRVEGIIIIWISLYVQNFYNNSWRKTKKYNSIFKSADNML